MPRYSWPLAADNYGWFVANDPYDVAGNRRIQDWVEHKRELERATLMTEDRKETIQLAEVDLIEGKLLAKVIQ